MKDINVNDDQFFEACQLGTEGANKQLFNQILAVDDFLSFKKLMLKRNKELEKEVLQTLQNDVKSSGNNTKKKISSSSNEEMKELEECIKLS
jgi:hypothetical protein